jgi:Possible lysine decarboxylase
MHERKALMVDFADAFVLLPGGFGSWEEFCEVVTWLQLGLHQKAVWRAECGRLLRCPDVAYRTCGRRRISSSLVPRIGDSGGESPTLLSQLGTAALPTEEKWVTTKER